MEVLFEMKEYKKEYEAKLLDFLEHCLPESGRALDINGRHAFYMDIENCFKAFLCLFCGEKIIGTVAVKELNKTDCELKSLYLLECYQGRGYGKELLHKAINFARQSGFEKMYLDSLSTSTRAIALYRRAGFIDVQKYNQSERSDVFMVLELNGKDKG